MSPVTSLLLRKMRVPLIALIASYSISIAGMVLVPGVDDQGNPWHMSFFHAFYFVSYTATTIGFGEIPYTLTDAQRVWVLISIYLTVVTWFYAVGAILTMLQDPAFKRAVVQGRFARQVRQIHEPFYLIAGYGEIGRAMAKSLVEHDMRVVVIDQNEDRVNLLKLDNYDVHIPALAANASLPNFLIDGGLQHPDCKGVIALTACNQTNLKVAITAKSLNPAVKVICRAESKDVEDNMSAFGTDYIIDPFDTFADRLALALRSPGLYLLYDWLSGAPDTDLTEPVYPPHGIWLLCGYGRFGRAIHKKLAAEGISTIILEPNQDLVEQEVGVVYGRGTEEKTLKMARIDLAAGVVAGTDSDENNLSIIMAARSLKQDLFILSRQNQQANAPLYNAIAPDITMQVSDILARRIRVLLTTPLLSDFFNYARQKDNEWANVTISRLAAIVEDSLPEVWSVEIGEEEAVAVWRAVELGRRVRIENLLQDPRLRDRNLACVPLMLVRGTEVFLMPEDNMHIETGDQILFCGDRGMSESMSWVLEDIHTLNYVMLYEGDPDGYLWGWMRRWRHGIERRDPSRTTGG